MLNKIVLKKLLKQTEFSPISLFTASGSLTACCTLLSNLQHLRMKYRTKHSWRAKVNMPSTIMVLSAVEGKDEK